MRIEFCHSYDLQPGWSVLSGFSEFGQPRTRKIEAVEQTERVGRPVAVTFIAPRETIDMANWCSVAVLREEPDAA